jgi:hypothetical protein
MLSGLQVRPCSKGDDRNRTGDATARGLTHFIVLSECFACVVKSKNQRLSVPGLDVFLIYAENSKERKAFVNVLLSCQDFRLASLL